MRFPRLTAAAATVLTACAVVPATTSASASHRLWPTIDMLLMNKTDANRPLDARPGMDPFGGRDPQYRCDGVHTSGACQKYFTSGNERVVRPDVRIHSELLGGHGDDELHAGPLGDVLWGDFKPKDQPASQTDQLFGGVGNDHIYVSHGKNTVDAGAGRDRIHAKFGHGTIDCGAGDDVVFVNHTTVKKYKRVNCEQISYKQDAD